MDVIAPKECRSALLDKCLNRKSDHLSVLFMADRSTCLSDLSDKHFCCYFVT